MAKKPSIDQKRAKLLVCIIKKKDEIALAEAMNECCVSLHFSGIAFGTAKTHYMSYLGLDEVEKRLVYSLIPDYCERQVLRAINRRLKLYLVGNGIAFTIPLSGISSIVSNAILSTPVRDEATTETNKNTAEKERNKMHELIVAVVNQKYTDKVLDASRAAGATGATILHTRSVSNQQAEQLIGTTFSQETDTVALLTSYEYGKVSMGVVRSSFVINEEGILERVMYKVKADTNAQDILDGL